MKSQILFFGDGGSETNPSRSEWGTFKDSLKAPVHSWFTYPAGFSYKAVESSFRQHKIKKGDVVYDPFMGSGTTNLTAKKMGISSYGMEAHPFVFKVAECKMNWAVNTKELIDFLKETENIFFTEKKKMQDNNNGYILKKEFPELILKCYEEKTLSDLLLIRNIIKNAKFTEAADRFYSVALTALLRQVSIAATGWPYVAPKKLKSTSSSKDVWTEFRKQINKMISDLDAAIAESGENFKKCWYKLYNHDARNTVGIIADESADHVFTSPPYLNNFDYADRTRLEMYFFGEAKTWGDISENVRSKLMTSATTQITRSDPRYLLSEDLRNACPKVYEYLHESVEKLAGLRLTKGGKKSYDFLVAGYFNDIYSNIRDVFRILKRNKKAVYVLGDSAPYGVYIPTDRFIGEIALGIGFSDYKMEVLRERGGKWKKNPQRHDVMLRESVVTLIKD